MKKVDVIIPMYNRECHIQRSIESVLGQTWSNVDVIVVDDCSTDGSADVVRQIMKRDDRVKLLRSDAHLGANHARNIGLRYATSDYIAFQDSDDEWYPEKLEKQMSLMEQGRYDMVYCRVYRTHITTGKSYVFPKDTLDPNKDIVKQFLHSCMAMTPSILIKKECFDHVQLDASMKRFQEWSFIISIVQRYRIGLVDEVLMRANVLADSVSSNIEMGYRYMSRFINDHIELIKRYPDIHAEFMMRKARYMVQLGMDVSNELHIAYQLMPSKEIYDLLILSKEKKYTELCERMLG